MTKRAFDTTAVHAGEASDPATGALAPSVVIASAFAFADAEDAAARFSGEREGNIYSRWGNPTVTAFEQKVAALEGADAGVSFASGMGAVHAALASNLKSGDHVVAATGLYAESAQLLRDYFSPFGVRTSFVDASDPSLVASALSPNTRVIYVETPANPTLAITDIAALASIETEATLIVDSTFATPFHTRPLELGADLVLHSATKALGGHGDAIGGVLVGDAARIARAREVGVRGCGAALSAFNAMLLARGVRTLGLRMAQSSTSAAELARRLDEDARVRRVHYPGLASHPNHETASKQMTNGFGSLVAFELTDGSAAGERCYNAIELIARAVSLGDVRSLMTHPASTTHSSWTDAERAAAGIDPGLMRLSVGIEALEDLWSDLDRALGSLSGSLYGG